MNKYARFWVLSYCICTSSARGSTERQHEHWITADMSHKPILKVGRNCWRICRANNVAFLIDRKPYFRALYHSLSLAQQQILILGYNIYSRLRLLPEEIKNRNKPAPTLEQIIIQLLKQKPQLEVNILSWDITLLPVLNSESLSTSCADWKTHDRLKLFLDNTHPPGASHHQKIVVIDDALAFSGDLDLMQYQPNTPLNNINDSKQQPVDDISLPAMTYGNVQMALSGPAAAALGSLVRERWRRANNGRLPTPQASDNNLWPTELDVDIENVDIAIARTEPAYDEYTEVYEVEQLYIDTIANAQDYIYIENQFFNVTSISKALAKRLAEKNGPEVVLNLPLNTKDWDTQPQQDVIRADIIKSLCEADRHGHLAIYYPHKPRNEKQPCKLHAKAMVIDKRIVCVGSASLNNQSMYQDTECSLAIESTSDNRPVKNAIGHFRNSLLAHHLGCTTDKIEQQVQQQSSLILAIENIRSDNSVLNNYRHIQQ